GAIFLVLTGPSSSTGSPTTFRMRPSVSGPTGTRMGAPVSSTSVPRTSPSVVSMAMVRTVLSPRCCATSSTRRLPWFWRWRALRILGSSPSNFTSTTAPMTWVMVPTLFLAMGLPLKRLGAGDDLDQLLGDVGLAGAVVGHRQPVDHVAGIAGGVVHRGHARALFARRVFEKGGVELDREVARQELGQDIGLVGLELIDALLSGVGRFRRRGGREGDELLAGHDLADRRAEAVVDDGDAVELAGGIAGDEAASDLLRRREAELRPTDIDHALDDELRIVAAQRIASLAADGEELHRLAGALKLADHPPCIAQDRGVEAAGETAV